MRNIRSKLFISAIASFIVMMLCGVLIPSTRDSSVQGIMVAILVVSSATFLVSCVMGALFFFIGLLKKVGKSSSSEE